MAKSKSPRKKKPANSKHAARHIVLAIKAAYNKLFFMGSSNCPIQAFKTNTLRMHLKPNDVRLAIPTLLDELRFFPRDWHLWVGVFCEKDGEQWVETSVCKMPQFVIKDFSDNAEHIVRGVMAEEAVEHMVGYAYLVAPNDYYNLEVMSDALCDEWVEAKIFDKSTHLDKDLLKMNEHDIAAAFMGLPNFVMQSRDKIVQKTIERLKAKGVKVTEEFVQSHFDQEEIVTALVPGATQRNPFKVDDGERL